jgi:hypothetical protein
VSTAIGKEWYQITYTKGSQSTTEGRPKLYLAKNVKIGQDGRALITFEDQPTQYLIGGKSSSFPSSKCDLKNQQHKFRFCAASPQKVYSYGKEFGLELKEVPIKFALDLYDAPPPAPTPDAVEIDKPQETINEENTNSLSPDKECKDFGKAEFTLKVTTPELQSAYEKFALQYLTKLYPQLTVLLFVKNVLVLKDSMPALVSVQLDLKGASKDCDITGLVYKCGVGIIPYKDGKFDFSSPNGYIDISPRFNAGGGMSVQSPDACMVLKNPDGAYTPARYIRPQITGDIVSFSLDKCADPILQFKKMDGVDIMTSALNGFGYYFAFAYTDSAGNYGKATIKSIQIPSVLQKLEEELGIKDWLVLVNLVRGDYEGIFNFLGLSDEFTFIRRAIASASLDRFLRNIKGEMFNAVLSKVEKNLNDPEAKEMFDYLAKNGRLDDSYAAKLLEKVKEEINYDEAVKVLDQLDPSDLRKTYDYYIKQLPLEKRKELLGQVYDKKDEIQRMSDAEVNKRLSAAMREKEKAIKIIKSLDLTEQVNLVKDFITQQPAKLLNIVNNAISDDKKAQAIRNVLTTASEKYKGLLRLMMSIASPDLQKIAFDAITNIPGLEEYKDSITQIFSDFEGGSCQ